MFVCLLKAHPWALTPPLSLQHPLLLNGMLLLRKCASPCVCVWTREWDCAVRMSEGGGGGFHHRIKWGWAQGPLCHRVGLICQWWAVRSWGRERNKGAKRLCDNEGNLQVWDAGCTGQAVPITLQLLFCERQTPHVGFGGDVQGHRRTRSRASLLYGWPEPYHAI